MPRPLRKVLINYPHHITQRGNNKRLIFRSEDDYLKYIDLYNHYSDRNGLETLAYCLMPNHVHFIGIPKSADSLSKTFHAINTQYSAFFNSKYELVGHLWQQRYFSCALDEPHLYAAIRYVELNPVSSQLVSTPERWRWSSCRGNMQTSVPDIKLVGTNFWITGFERWSDYLSIPVSAAEIDRIREKTRLGLPLGSDHFVQKMSALMGVDLKHYPVGRPRKTEAT
ncbi:MAG: transposase [Candidatus Omnitrophica bacterium]|nr:transposase [Candidatus Omnitrophota bacterium]